MCGVLLVRFQTKKLHVSTFTTIHLLCDCWDNHNQWSWDLLVASVGPPSFSKTLDYGQRCSNKVQDPAVTQPKWEERIMRKFTNYRSKEKNSLLVPKNVQSSHGAQKVVDTLVKFSSDISPRKLFEEECKKEISARALGLPDTVSNSAGRYQTAVAELWEKEDEAEWAARASISRDMAEEKFPQAMFDSLTCLAQTRKFGDLELMLFYGFQKENDDVETGIIKVTGHPIGCAQFGDILDVGVKNQYEMGWTVFIDVIKILTNGAGKPLFPTLNMDITPPECVWAVLSTFLDSVWISLRDPAKLNPVVVFRLAVYFESPKLTSNPFAFHPKCLILEQQETRYRDSQIDLTSDEDVDMLNLANTDKENLPLAILSETLPAARDIELPCSLVLSAAVPPSPKPENTQNLEQNENGTQNTNCATSSGQSTKQKIQWWMTRGLWESDATDDVQPQRAKHIADEGIYCYKSSHITILMIPTHLDGFET
ncbi:hypothetical protein C8J56DRAFT_900271 [Mycena floridula]|nr:hypothetical protein C8J56DRAFT_900271 [Mycena floridula]